MPNKKNIKSVEVLKEKLSKAKSIYFTDYLGLNVSDVTSLRKSFYESGVEYLVVKNTLLKIASSENKIKLDDDLFSGSTAIAVSYDEPVLAAKVIKNFLKTCFLWADSLDLFKINFQFLELLTIDLLDRSFVMLVVWIEQLLG